MILMTPSAHMLVVAITFVIPAKAGIRFCLCDGEELGPGLRRDDGVSQ
jgi:hypothetical protein